MLTIRLKRIGRRNDPSFRIIVTEKHRGPKSGKYIEMLGSYNPKVNEHSVNVERAKYWIEKGAQISDTVYNVFVDKKVVEGKKKNVLPKKTAPIKEVIATEEKIEEKAAPAEHPTSGEEVKETSEETM